MLRGVAISRWGLGLVMLLVAAGCRRGSARAASAEPEREPEAMSLLGRPLYAPPDTGPQVGGFAASSREEMIEHFIATGRELASQWHYRQALDLYTRAIELAPDDARLYRHRGHRYITLRQFEDAARDLDRAAELDSTSFDIAYHQGLAHYLLGHFARAAEVYARCMAQGEARTRRAIAADTVKSDPRRCSDVAVDDDALVAITDWRYRALRRAGRHSEAASLLEPIRDGLRVTDNLSYYQNLRRYAGRITEADVVGDAGTDSVRFATSGYGMANFRLVEGDTAGARVLLGRVAESPHWPGFGVIAAEADLVRLK